MFSAPQINALTLPSLHSLCPQCEAQKVPPSILLSEQDTSEFAFGFKHSVTTQFPSDAFTDLPPSRLPCYLTVIAQQIQRQSSIPPQNL